MSSAVSSVDSASLKNQPIASVDAALQGKAPGVQVVQNAGNPGNAVSVRVRGSASVSASNDPLYVIDGVPMIAGDISQLDAGGQGVAAIAGLSLDEVERVDVLKDAAAAAIYGSRGSNGVVMITTKRGTPGRTNVTFNSYVGTQSASRRLELMNSAEYVEFFNESASNDGYGENYYGELGVADSVSADWQDAVLRSAPVSNAELARQRRRRPAQLPGLGKLVRAGRDRRQLRVPQGRRQGQPRLQSQRKALTPDGVGRLRRSQRPGRERRERRGDHHQRRRRGARRSRSSTPMVISPPGRRPGVSQSGGLVAFNDIRARSTNILGNAEARYRITPQFQLTGRFGIDLVSLKEEQFESRKVSGTYASSANGVAKSGFSDANRYVMESFATVMPDLGTRHELEITGGGSLELNRGELNFVRGEGFSSDEFEQVRNATIITEFDGTQSENNLVSFFTRADYTLNKKYTFGGSLRTDGSSRFGPNDRWGVFPAVSASWLLSEESWRQGRVLRFPEAALQPRTHRQPGDQRLSVPGSGRQRQLRRPAGNRTEQPAQPRPEVGDHGPVQRGRGYGLRQGPRESQHRLVPEEDQRPAARSADHGHQRLHQRVRQRGQRHQPGPRDRLTTVNIDSRKTDGFRWTTTLNLGFNRNKVTALFNGQPFSDGIRSLNRVAVGQPIGAFYTLNFLGVDPATGDAIYQDLNGDGSINSDDFTIVGSPHPDYTGGFTSTFSWKGFDLIGFLTFSQGNEVFNAMRIFSDAGGWFLDNQFQDVLDRWQQPGDVTDTPRASYDGASGAAEISSRYMEDGSFWRLQDLTLGYRLPEQWAGRLGFASARFYGSVRNLFTITDYSGYSPDVNSNGSFDSDVGLGTDFYAYPQARTYSFGIQASW